MTAAIVPVVLMPLTAPFALTKRAAVGATRRIGAAGIVVPEIALAFAVRGGEAMTRLARTQIRVRTEVAHVVIPMVPIRPA